MCSCLLCEKAGQWKHVENADHSTWVWDEPVTHSTWYTYRGHSHTSPLYVCVWVCEYVSSGTFVCWGGKAPPTQGHLMRGEGRHEGECEKTEARRNKRKEGKNRIRTLRADSAGGEWINVFTCPKAQRFQRTRQSHSSPFPSPGWNEMHIYKQAYMLMWFSTFYENCGNPVNQAYAEILQACDLILKPQLLIFMSWVTFDRFFFF